MGDNLWRVFFFIIGMGIGLLGSSLISGNMVVGPEQMYANHCSGMPCTKGAMWP